MSKNSKYLTMAATLTGLLALAPALVAQNQGTTSGSNTSGSSGGGSMDSHPGTTGSNSGSMDSGNGSMGTTGSGSMAKSGSSMSKMSSGDSMFVKNAAMGGMTEVAAGQLAAQKATDPDVKSFGQRMVDDHTKANDQLKQIATQKGMTPPTTMSSMQKKDIDKLNGLSGAAFDKAYLDMMVKDHKKTIAEFQKEAKSGKDSDIKSFASSTLPTLQDHKKMVDDLHSKSGKMSKSGGMSH